MLRCKGKEVFEDVTALSCCAKRAWEGRTAEQANALTNSLLRRRVHIHLQRFSYSGFRVFGVRGVLELLEFEGCGRLKGFGV